MRLVVVDDDKLVCNSLKTILEASGEVSVVGTGYNGKEAIRLYKELRPDVLLMDIRMEEMTGLEAGELILQEDKAAKILYLTTFVDDEYIVKALNIGAKGYILKQDFESLLPALKAVFTGQIVFGENIVTKLPKLMKEKRIGSFIDFNLNEKEQEIISLVAEGLNNREIASKLFLSEGTVRNYLSVILEKLNLRDRTQLAIFYYKNK